MSTPVKITGTMKTWTTSKYFNIDHVYALLDEGKTQSAISCLNFTNSNMSNCEDWVEVGSAEITVTLFHRDEVIANELDGLNTQLQKVRAENQQRENAILDRISKLQALEWTA
jgi:hypothetical protein